MSLRIPRILLVLSVGSLLGFLGARYLFVGSWLCLIPWTIAGLVLGYASRKGEPTLTGAAYGFALSFVFMIAGYGGAASLLSRLPSFALLGLFGALCGLLLSLVGFFCKSRFMTSTDNG